MEEIPYKERLRVAARTDFKKFWSDYRWWITVVGFFNLPLIVQGLFGKHSMIDFGVACIYALISLIFSLLGSWAIAMRRGAEVLDSQKSTTITGLTDQNLRLHESAYPKVLPQELRRREIVRKTLNDLGPEGRKVIQYILDSGPTSWLAMQHSGADGNYIMPTVNQAMASGLLEANEKNSHIWVKKELQEATRFVLENWEHEK
jgi:hypothetical protein